METSIDTKSAFERINHYIEVNNCQLLAPIIDSIMLEYAEQYYKDSESDNDDESYCLINYED
jgi:hypothetical protein